ncbi:MAG: helix-turn-helix domain-containing protein [Candidatus Brocadiales bacterium]
MELNFEDTELDRLADALALKVAEKLKPLLRDKGKENNGLFTVETLAQYLCVKKQWVYEKVHLKEIPYFKIGKFPRFRKVDIDSWLQESYTPPLNGILNHFKEGGK